MADCYVLLPIYRALSVKEAFPKAKAAALQALQIDEQLAEAYTSLAIGYARYNWDWESAEKSFIRAIELNSNYATAHQWYAFEYLSNFARHDEAIAEMKRALELDPLSLIVNTDLGWIYCNARYYDLAVQQLQKTLEMDQNFYMAHLFLGMAYIFKGEISKGVEQLGQAMPLADDPIIVATMGYGHGVSGNREEAEKTIVLLEEISAKREVSSYEFAIIYAGLGDKEKALEILQQSLDQQEWLLIFLKVQPFWDNLRDDPRFVELLKKVGLE